MLGFEGCDCRPEQLVSVNTLDGFDEKRRIGWVPRASTPQRPRCWHRYGRRESFGLLVHELPQFGRADMTGVVQQRGQHARVLAFTCKASWLFLPALFFLCSSFVSCVSGGQRRRRLRRRGRLYAAGAAFVVVVVVVETRRPPPPPPPHVEKKYG